MRSNIWVFSLSSKITVIFAEALIIIKKIIPNEEFNYVSLHVIMQQQRCSHIAFHVDGFYLRFDEAPQITCSANFIKTECVPCVFHLQPPQG